MAQLTLGQLLTKARLARGFRQTRVAAAARIKASVSFPEHDGPRPSLGRRLSLSAAAWCGLLRRAFSRRPPVVPPEAFAAQPRAYQVWTILAFAVALGGLVLAWNHTDPRAIALVALTFLLDAALVPVVRNPAGGLTMFHSPLVLATGLLYSPAAAFAGGTGEHPVPSA